MKRPYQLLQNFQKYKSPCDPIVSDITLVVQVCMPANSFCISNVSYSVLINIDIRRKWFEWGH